MRSRPLAFLAVLAGLSLALVLLPVKMTVKGQGQNFPLVTAPFGQSAYGEANATILVTQNNVACWGFYLPFSITTGTLTYDVNTADNTANVYDIGLYDTNGARKAHTGPLAGTTLFPGTGIMSVSWTGGSVSLAPGRYYAALTSSAAAPLAKFSGNIQQSFQGAVACGTSSSGTLPDPMTTVPADSWAKPGVPSFTLR